MWIFDQFSSLPPNLASSHPCAGAARGSPPVLTAEVQGQAGDGEQEAEQSQGSQEDAQEGSQADGQPLTLGASRGVDGEGQAAVDGEGGAVMLREEQLCRVALSTPGLLLPAHGPLGQVLALAPVLAIAHLAGGDADEADGARVVEPVAFVAVQRAGEIVPQLIHCHWGGKAHGFGLAATPLDASPSWIHAWGLPTHLPQECDARDHTGLWGQWGHSPCSVTQESLTLQQVGDVVPVQALEEQPRARLPPAPPPIEGSGDGCGQLLVQEPNDGATAVVGKLGHYHEGEAIAVCPAGKREGCWQSCCCLTP